MSDLDDHAKRTATLHAAEKRTLEMIANGADLSDVERMFPTLRISTACSRKSKAKKENSMSSSRMRALQNTHCWVRSVKNKGGSIILNASIVASKGLPANSVYSATKAAVRSFARTWTTDLKDRQIRVNVVSHDSTDTEGLRELLGSSEVGEQRLKTINASVPLGRLAKPKEIARAVVFLASDDSSYITGTELFVDGGFAQV